MDFLSEYSLSALGYLENKWGAVITETETRIQRAEERLENRLNRQDANSEEVAAAQATLDGYVEMRAEMEDNGSSDASKAMADALIAQAEVDLRSALTGGSTMTEAEEANTKTGIEFDKLQLVALQDARATVQGLIQAKA